MSANTWITPNDKGFQELTKQRADSICKRAANQVAALTGLEARVVKSPSATRTRYKIFTIPKADGNYYQWKTYNGKHVLKPISSHPLLSAIKQARV